MKEIRDYLYKNNVYVWKEARKSITNNLLEIIHKPTPLKWLTNDFVNKPTNNSAGNPTDDSTDDPINNFTDDPTNNSTLALLLLSTASV